jgi:hypothetical protein
MAVLKTWRNRSWFTDPAGWAHDALATRAGYVSFQILCVCGAILSCVSIWVPAHHLEVGLQKTWGLYVIAVVFSGVLPSIYLRAARKLVLETKSHTVPREPAA